MKLQDFEQRCPAHAHISIVNFVAGSKDYEVESAKGYDMEDPNTPGYMTIVWNRHGEAYSRRIDEDMQTNFTERNRVVVYDSRIYERDRRFDLIATEP